MNPEQWLSLKWNGGSTMSDRWLNQSKIIQFENVKYIAAGGYNMAVITEKNNLYLWGDNTYG